MILYFSGTGNSRFVARELGKQLEDQVVSMNECMRTRKAHRFTSGKSFVIVAPIYASRLPFEVEEYLKMCRFSGSRDIWFIVTCGGGMGGTEKYCRKIAESKGLTYHGTGCIVMPNNYVALFDVITSEEGYAKAEAVLPEIQEISRCISKGEELHADPKLKAMPQSSAFAGLFHRLLFRDKAFRVNDRCVGCAQCETVCPMHDISLQEGKPVWQGKCMHCMACISVCPVKAIDYGRKTETRNRYYLK